MTVFWFDISSVLIPLGLALYFPLFHIALTTVPCSSFMSACSSKLRRFLYLACSLGPWLTLCGGCSDQDYDQGEEIVRKETASRGLNWK